MFVSNIEETGMECLAALGFILPITIILQAFANLIGLGWSPRASMKLGEGKKDEANRIFSNVFLLLLLIGIYLSLVCFFLAEPLVKLFGCPESAISYAASYLKAYSIGIVFLMLGQELNPFLTAQDRSFLVMVSILIGVLISIGLDPLFIFVFRLGETRAAYVTIISQFCSFAWIIAIFFTKGSVFHFSLKEMNQSGQTS
jgi:Na+-driven multidrug efflux pump